MKLQAIASSVALAAALTFSGPVYAQAIMLDGVEVPGDQVDSFKGKCEALRAASTASLTADENANIDETTTGSVTSQDPASSTTDSSDPAAQDNWEEAIASLTLEECEAAGL
jgi:hypothetical protein